MSEIPKDLRFTDEHEWVRVEGQTVRMGISDYAQHELGDIVFVELPKVGTAVKKGEVLATVESVKAASDVYAPVDGTVSAVNDALSGSPEAINSAPYSDGWLVLFESAASAQVQSLKDSSAYEVYVAEISK